MCRSRLLTGADGEAIFHLGLRLIEDNSMHLKHAACLGQNALLSQNAIVQYALLQYFFFFCFFFFLFF